MKRATQRLILFPALFTAAAAPALQPARAPDLPALKAIERGAWNLRERGAKAARRVCVANPVALMQVRHGTSACSRYVIDNQPRQATVHYTCPGAGHGRTTIKVETSRLISIESQGIADNAPFNFIYEGRHAGACG